MSECRAASPKVISARWTPGLLTIYVAGELESSGWAVSVEMTMIEVWPPEFSVVECRSHDFDQPVLTPYVKTRAFEFATSPGSTVMVHTADGVQTIKVETSSEVSSSNAVVTVTIPGADLSRALSAAVETLRGQEHPNVPVTAVVEEIRYTEGGIMSPMIGLEVRRG